MTRRVQVEETYEPGHGSRRVVSEDFAVQNLGFDDRMQVLSGDDGDVKDERRGKKPRA